MPARGPQRPPNLHPAWSFALLVQLVAIGLMASAQVPGEGKGGDGALPENRFADPFFQFTSAVADCPLPLGPRITLAEQLAQMPQREAWGPHCMLEKPCKKPNDFAYDADIGTALQEAVQSKQLYSHSPLVNSSLWITVQARVVTVEGCVAGDVPTGFDHAFIARHLEVLANSVPEVKRAVVRIRTSAQARAGVAVPYPTLHP